MYQTVADSIREVIISFLENPEGETKKKFIVDPLIKPKRRGPSYKNKSNKVDYMKNYMQDYRKDKGKDYQPSTEAVKELKRKQKKRLEEKFDL